MPMSEPPLWKRCAAEWFGTFSLVFVGTGSVIVNDLHGGVLGQGGVAAAFGLVVLAMIYALGDVSGAHLNPAVSFGFWIAGRMPGRLLAPYAAAQAGGAVAASGLLRLLFPQHAGLGATLPAGSAAQAFLLEVVLSAMLVFVILTVAVGARERGITAGIVVGGVVGLAALFGGPVSGASMNPARSLGPAVISGEVASLWIYLLAPLCGAVAARAICAATQEKSCCRRPGVLTGGSSA